jgi:voltage-gated potassium channel
MMDTSIYTIAQSHFLSSMTGTVSGQQPGWYDRIQEEVYILLESNADDNKARKFIIYFIATLILLNVLVVILETEHLLYLKYGSEFVAFDHFTVIVFSIEYVLRVWVCVRNPLYSSPLKGRLRYMASPFAIVDLIAITPFYLPLIIPVEFRLLRLLRLLRIFRVLKLGRFSNAFETFVDVLRAKKEELTIAVIMAVIILLLSSSALYEVEREAQPVKFGSIPDAMWWAVVTLATVGYGDVYPITPLGKFISAIVALSAIGLFALPAGVLAAGFAESIQKRCAVETGTTVICPVCGTVFAPQAGMSADNPKRAGEHGSLPDESTNCDPPRK